MSKLDEYLYIDQRHRRAGNRAKARILYETSATSWLAITFKVAAVLMLFLVIASYLTPDLKEIQACSNTGNKGNNH